MQIAVIGAGISGLSTAFVLRKSGHDVTIWSKDFSPHTTSNKAAAFWFPYHIRNDKRGVDWCRKSYEVYSSFVADKATGVSMKKIIKAIRDTSNADNSWIDFMPAGSCHPINIKDLPNGYAMAYSAEVPLIETQIFLPWLMQQLEILGVKIIHKKIHGFKDISSCDFIINCSGLGSLDLEKDDLLFPIRGQVALLEPLSYPEIFLENEKPLYIVPRKDAMIIGGTYEENVWSEQPEDSAIALLLENVFEIYPKLRKQKLIGSWAGLRPFRKEVRLERSGNIIHNYGHGGSGFTLAWGCAETVKDLVNNIKSEKI